MEVIYHRDSPSWWIIAKTSWRTQAIWQSSRFKLNALGQESLFHLVFSCYSCATRFGHFAKLLHMFLNKSWNNLSHTPSLLHSQHAMQRTTWPPAVAWEPSHPHSWCVCVRVCVRKILALAQDKVIWYCTAPTSMNNSEEQERREMWQASSTGKERKRDLRETQMETEWDLSWVWVLRLWKCYKCVKRIQKFLIWNAYALLCLTPDVLALK